MKGVSELLSHMTLIALGLIALSMILVSVSNLRINTRQQSIENNLNYLAETIADEILRLDSIAEQSNAFPEINKIMVLGKIELPISEKISNKRYLIELYNKTVRVSTYTGNGMIEVNRTVNTNAFLNETSNLQASLQLERYNQDGVFIDIIRLVK